MSRLHNGQSVLFDARALADRKGRLRMLEKERLRAQKEKDMNWRTWRKKKKVAEMEAATARVAAMDDRVKRLRREIAPAQLWCAYCGWRWDAAKPYDCSAVPPTGKEVLVARREAGLKKLEADLANISMAPNPMNDPTKSKAMYANTEARLKAEAQQARDELAAAETTIGDLQRALARAKPTKPSCPRCIPPRCARRPPRLG